MSQPWHEGAYLIEKHGLEKAEDIAYSIWMKESHKTFLDENAVCHGMAIYSYILGYRDATKKVI